MRLSPIVKWAGGKTKVLPYFLPLYEASQCTRLVDLFCGSLSLPLAIPHPTHTEAVFNDVNTPLINLYTSVQQEYSELTRVLEQLNAPYMNTREQYENIREVFNFDREDPVLTGARFLYLNRRGFNGLYRENRSGEFNVPYRAYNTPIYSPETFSEFSEWCQSGLTFYNRDVFSFPLEFFRPGDLVYLDPPYYPSDESKFTSYWRTPFHVKEQIALAEFCAKLDKRGIKFIVSNSPCEQVRKLYQGFHQHEFRIERQMRDAKQGSKGSSSQVNEILIWNFGKLNFD